MLHWVYLRLLWRTAIRLLSNRCTRSNEDTMHQKKNQEVDQITHSFTLLTHSPTHLAHSVIHSPSHSITHPAIQSFSGSVAHLAHSAPHSFRPGQIHLAGFIRWFIHSFGHPSEYPQQYRSLPESITKTKQQLRCYEKYWSRNRGNSFSCKIKKTKKISIMKSLLVFRSTTRRVLRVSLNSLFF